MNKKNKDIKTNDHDVCNEICYLLRSPNQSHHKAFYMPE